MQQYYAIIIAPDHYIRDSLVCRRSYLISSIDHAKTEIAFLLLIVLFPDFLNGILAFDYEFPYTSENVANLHFSIALNYLFLIIYMRYNVLTTYHVTTLQ